MAGAPQYRAGWNFENGPEMAAAETAHRVRSYQALVSRVVAAFGDEVKASRWLSLPNVDLGGQTPIQAVQNCGYDFQVIEPILTRIEHGVDY